MAGAILSIGTAAPSEWRSERVWIRGADETDSPAYG